MARERAVYLVQMLDRKTHLTMREAEVTSVSSYHAERAARRKWGYHEYEPNVLIRGKLVEKVNTPSADRELVSGVVVKAVKRNVAFGKMFTKGNRAGVSYLLGLEHNGRSYWGTLPKELLDLLEAQGKELQDLVGTTVVLSAVKFPRDDKPDSFWFRYPSLEYADAVQSPDDFVFTE